MVFIFWIVFSILIGYLAEEKKSRSGAGWFFLSIFTTPLISGIFLLMSSNLGTKKCPKCAEPVKKEAIKCKHCGNEFAQSEINQKIG